jgi:hypothetical protein
MTVDATDGHIDQLVKARWLVIGLSQTDLFEVLDAACRQTPRDGNEANGIDADRLIQIAKAFDIPGDLFRSQIAGTAQQAPDLASARNFSSRRSLVELRLLRAFQRMRDDRTKLMLVHLAEQIVRRQANRGGEPSEAG